MVALSHGQVQVYLLIHRVHVVQEKGRACCGLSQIHPVTDSSERTRTVTPARSTSVT